MDHRANPIATPGRLARRLAACQLVGTFAGLLVAVAIGGLYRPLTAATGSLLSDALLIALFALGLFGPVFYGIALLLLLAFTRSILLRPFLWSVAAPLALLALALWALPIAEREGVHWIALIPLCAAFAGILFYAWLRTSPLAAPALASGGSRRATLDS